MRNCHIFVGLPAMGKSTLIKSRGFVGAVDTQYHVHSTDNCIELMANKANATYDEIWSPENMKLAEITVNNELDKVLRRPDSNLIWDQTNVGVGKRRRVLNRIRNAGRFFTRCHVIVPPSLSRIGDWVEIRRRLDYRSQVEGKTIPKEVFNNMLNSFVTPTLDEGFDQINSYNIYGVLTHVQ